MHVEGVVEEKQTEEEDGDWNEEKSRFVYFAHEEVAIWKDRSMICTFLPFSTAHPSLILRTLQRWQAGWVTTADSEAVLCSKVPSGGCHFLLRRFHPSEASLPQKCGGLRFCSPLLLLHRQMCAEGLQPCLYPTCVFRPSSAPTK